MKEEAPASTISIATQTSDSVEPPSMSREGVAVAPVHSHTPTSPTLHSSSKTPSRKVLRLKCPLCSDYPDGFRSEHELRRHTNRVHRKTRKVWVTIDTSPDKSFLANCKACQTGKRYNECYNAASHLRRMHFHPHKRGERKMTAAEARKGGKATDLDPPMDVLKTNWLREVDEFVEGDDSPMDGVRNDSLTSPPPQLQRPSQQPFIGTKTESKAPPTPTTPSTRSMAIDSIVDKVDAA
ncbi:uncharacterized protein EKO05_0004288 [Ascochyta rabiei]|uniref:DUF7896 domain-containing protein n=1 Tax=Didymella rabiei TaxID=5454 RepID=A0A162Y9X3_DIDRA|nr:uncharacterized protein EKO05_0004288 [Ascochyta rabiei]KZM19904.1 hypothetical protein ST47_g9038 [Ascochyta rabiei]UPX13789.1 hypothetical protein EKO05_0004288 [Ascochyta rabiei]